MAITRHDILEILRSERSKRQRQAAEERRSITRLEKSAEDPAGADRTIKDSVALSILGASLRAWPEEHELVRCLTLAGENGLLEFMVLVDGISPGSFDHGDWTVTFIGKRAPAYAELDSCSPGDRCSFGRVIHVEDLQ